MDRSQRSTDRRLARRRRSRPTEEAPAPALRNETLALFGVHITAMIAACAGIAVALKVPESRGLLPEPLDYFDHATNVGHSFNAVGLLHLAAKKTGIVSECSPAFAAAVGLAVNALAESQVGPMATATTDPIDFTYGLIAALVAGVLTRALDGRLALLDGQPQVTS